jgi:hypothetical protein
LIGFTPPADAGSGCGALLKAAKKGYRGDPAALMACQGAVTGGQHVAHAKPRALQPHDMVSDTRDLKAFKHRKHDDPLVRQQMKGVTALRRADVQASDEMTRQRNHRRAQKIDEAAGNFFIILKTIDSSRRGHY